VRCKIKKQTMDKVSFIRLWDVYRGLLTPTQQEITDLYFNLDLTLSEIAEQKGITRQGVSECLKTCKKQLEEYEEKLQFSRRLAKMCLETSLAFTEAGAWAEKFKKAFPEASGELKKLELILQKDYAEEAERLLDNPQSAETLNSDGTRAVYGRKKSGED